MAAHYHHLFVAASLLSTTLLLPLAVLCKEPHKIDLLHPDRLSLSSQERQRLQTIVTTTVHPTSKQEAECMFALRLALLNTLHPTKDLFPSLNVNDDRHLACFCRARRHDLALALQMWNDAVSWRHGNAQVLKTITSGSYVPPRALNEYGIGGTFGVDREGAPVLYLPIGRIDPQGLFAHLTVAEFALNELVQLEATQNLLDKRSVEDNKAHLATHVIIDLEGLGWAHVSSVCGPRPPTNPNPVLPTRF
jgi:hypothetical protein